MLMESNAGRGPRHDDERARATGICKASRRKAASLFGYQVIVSDSIRAGDIIFLKPTEILLADDGNVTIDISREASLQLDSNPAEPPTGMMSLWQQNAVGIRAERYINWKRRRPELVFYHFWRRLRLAAHHGGSGDSRTVLPSRQSSFAECGASGTTFSRGRSFVRRRAKFDLYLETPWPELYADIDIRFVRGRRQLRTQQKNIARQASRPMVGQAACRRMM